LEYIKSLRRYAKDSKRTYAVICKIAKNHNIGNVVMKGRVRTIMLTQSMIDELDETKRR